MLIRTPDMFTEKMSGYNKSVALLVVFLMQLSTRYCSLLQFHSVKAAQISNQSLFTNNPLFLGRLAG